MTLNHLADKFIWSLMLLLGSRQFSEARIFFFNDTATTEIYTLSLHDALPISTGRSGSPTTWSPGDATVWSSPRSEEHTSELQSRENLVCRLLLEKKKYDRNLVCVALLRPLCDVRYVPRNLSARVSSISVVAPL